MKQKPKILCTTCARGGSKGVPNKNIRLINGRPLIAYSIEQAKKTGLFDYIVVSTDCDDIANVANEYGAEVFFMRSPELSSDFAGKLEVIKDAFVRSERHYKKQFDLLVDIDATSPLRYVTDIVNAVRLLIDGNYKNIITACESHRSPYFNMVEKDKFGHVRLSKPLPNALLRRQDAPKSFDMNASIYVWERETILNKNTLFLPETGLYVMPAERSFDIDTMLDFKIVSFLLNQQEEKVNLITER